ncbi:MAG TPA: adenosylcobalamin-dependent ribonucleoside-diphosphate reductase [Candidatus Polarisedimenticolia bacterium]|nr:adenosylcobalamin-dependent ribonucleoside-diphosphate reductase [Candidatus Polarisedimenticolia bacterium]
MNPASRARPLPPQAAGATLTPHALFVLERRYLARDENGRPLETPDQMFRRVADNVASADERLPFEGRKDPAASAATFYRMMSSLEFLPNSPTLMNAGRELQQLCACFVLPVEDSMEGIFEALKDAAVIHKTGGGTGFSFSRLRPRNSRVRTTSGIASGPVSFMKVFNAATEAIKQGGMRRGANMGILRVDHPDIMEFIDCKRDGGEITNFNISVAVTDVFMRALAEDTSYDLSAPGHDGSPGRPAGSLRARDVFDRMCLNAWLSGEPGVVFIDRINETNPTRHVGLIEATNPCGEQPLSANEACTLGSINLGQFVLPGEAPSVDEERLARAVRDAVHFLDNVIEVSRYPIPAIEAVTRANRRIGLGVMGWADLLIALGIPYDSQEALDLADRLMGLIAREARRASQDLAADRGPFPNHPGSLHDVPGAAPLRNATTTTVAPTGTISMIAGASGGIEPLFAVAFTRRHVLDLGDGEGLHEVHPAFLERARAAGILTDDLMERVAARGAVRGFGDDEVPASLRRLFGTAHDIEPAWHVRMQAAFQRHCDNAVSKTVNLPESSTPSDVERVFLGAWRLGCKGVTVYRHRSRRRQVMSTGPEPSGPGPEPAGSGGRSPSSRGEALARFSRGGPSGPPLEALGRALHRAMRSSRPASPPAPGDPFRARNGRDRCPDCGGAATLEAGCLFCPDCGSSQCP